MAHTCPECGMLCHCGGDIDDLQWGDDSPEAMGCSHWKECEGDEDDEDFYPVADEDA